MQTNYTIGALATECGCKVQTLRYYETIGLMPVPERNQGNQRIYNLAQRKRLLFIRHARQLGFSLDQIREILTLADTPEQSCEAVSAIAEAHLREVTQKIQRLQVVQTELQRMVMQCSADKVADCRIMEVLADHALCHADHD